MAGNPNHDPKSGEFSTGPGGSRQHPNAAANAHDVHASLASSLPSGGPKGVISATGNTESVDSAGGINGAIREGLKTAKTGSIDDIIQPRDGHSYRFLTGSEYSDALSTGKLSPGPNSGGLLNFSTKPIAVYGASAWRSPGLLVEMPDKAIASRKSAEFYPTSTDSSAFLRGESIPLSEASRVFGYQWDNGIKAVDVTRLVRRQTRA